VYLAVLEDVSFHLEGYFFHAQRINSASHVADSQGGSKDSCEEKAET